jgi:hypothetical protein
MIKVYERDKIKSLNLHVRPLGAHLLGLEIPKLITQITTQVMI